MNVNKVAFPGHAASGAEYRHPRPWSESIEPAVLPELLAEATVRHARRPLVEFLGATYSYADIYDEACRFAAGLKRDGIGKGDRVGLFMPNVPAYVSAYYGAMMAGAVVVNFSPLYSVEELSHQVADSGTRVLVTLDVPALLPTAEKVLDASTLERLIVSHLADALPTFKSAGLRLFKRGDLAKIPARPDVVEWSDALAHAGWTEWLDGEAPGVNDLALLQYTGGTTGTPKGAMLTHANLSSNARQVNAIDPFDQAEPDVVMGGLPLFHVFANTCVLNRTILRGGTMVMVPRFEPKLVLSEIERCQVTAFPGVPTMYQALLDHPSCATTDFSALKICISGGAPLSGKLREEFGRRTGVRLIEGYGLTESSGVVSTNPYQGEFKPGTIGQLLPGTRAILLDKEDPGKLAPEGQPGELALSGPQMMDGYWNRPASGNEVFVTHHEARWLRTGDVAEIDADGFLSIVDRMKDMIAVGGFKVFPSQVEEVLLQHEAVKEVLVIGVPDAYRGEAPRAYATLIDDKEIDEMMLAEWLNARIGKHERVDKVVIRDELPRTMIGKLDRKALRNEVLG